MLWGENREKWKKPAAAGSRTQDTSTGGSSQRCPGFDSRRLPAFFTFVYFRLITSKFIYSTLKAALYQYVALDEKSIHKAYHCTCTSDETGWIHSIRKPYSIRDDSISNSWFAIATWQSSRNACITALNCASMSCDAPELTCIIVIIQTTSHLADSHMNYFCCYFA